MKVRKFLLFIILAATLASCSDSLNEKKYPVPVFINDSPTNRAIHMDITDVWKGESKFFYYTNFPLIMSFRYSSLHNMGIETRIAGEPLRLTISDYAGYIHYKGQTENVYIDILLDKEKHTFDYRQIVFIDALVSVEDLKPYTINYASITEGNNLMIKEDGGIKGSYESLIFTSMPDATAETIGIGELFSEGGKSAVALLYAYNSLEEYEFPQTMGDAKGIFLSDIDTEDKTVDYPFRLYWQDGNEFHLEDYSFAPDFDVSEQTDEKRFSYIKEKAFELFDGKWNLESTLLK